MTTNRHSGIRHVPCKMPCPSFLLFVRVISVALLCYVVLHYCFSRLLKKFQVSLSRPPFIFVPSSDIVYICPHCLCQWKISLFVVTLLHATKTLVTCMLSKRILTNNNWNLSVPSDSFRYFAQMSLWVWLVSILFENTSDKSIRTSEVQYPHVWNRKKKLIKLHEFHLRMRCKCLRLVISIAALIFRKIPCYWMVRCEKEYTLGRIHALGLASSAEHWRVIVRLYLVMACSQM